MRWRFMALCLVGCVGACGDSDDGGTGSVEPDAGAQAVDASSSSGGSDPVDAGRDGGDSPPQRADGGGAFCETDDDCDDGRYCTGEEACVVGRCAPGTLVDCSDGVECTEDRCDDDLKACVNRPDHELCDEGTARICDADTGCIEVVCDDAEACDDGKFCNGAEICPDGFCDGGESPNVDDKISCTEDVCDEDVQAPKHIARDTKCDDGKFCTGVEVCDPKSGCVVSEGPQLDDGVACTVDACDEETKAITHAATDHKCDDEDECTIDRCDPEDGCVQSLDATACPCTPTGDCSPFESGDCVDQSCRPKTLGGVTECQDVGAPMIEEGELCDGVTDWERCERGTYCLSLGSDGQRCRRLCPKDSVGFCAQGQACSANIGDSCLYVCKDFPEPCDPYDQDCSDSDDTCTFATHPETGENYTGCRPAGEQNVGQPCGGANGTCNHGLVCISVGGDPKCREICDLDDGDPGCGEPGEMCDGLSTNYNVTYCK